MTADPSSPSPPRTPPAPRPPRKNGLPRAQRLLRSNDFARVERQGSRAHGVFVTLVARATGHPTRARVGFTVSKKVGNAVMRNFVKRRLRDIARRHKEAWRGKDLVVIAKPEAAGRSLHELEADVLATLAKLDVTPPPRGSHGKPRR